MTKTKKEFLQEAQEKVEERLSELCDRIDRLIEVTFADKGRVEIRRCFYDSSRDSIFVKRLANRKKKKLHESIVKRFGELGYTVKVNQFSYTDTNDSAIICDVVIT
jgi:hypothetical protein